MLEASQTLAIPITAVLVSAVFLAGLCVVLRKIRFSVVSSERPQPVSDRLAARYRPMWKLLDKDEYRFLAARDPSLAARVRAERRTFFRAYLRALNRDHAKICSGIRSVMVHSEIDRPDLAMALLKGRVLFTAACVAIEFRLALHAAGSGTLDVRDLVAAVEAMRIQWESMAAVQPASI